MVALVVFLYVEVHASVADVGVAGLEDLLYGLYLLDDVAAGARLDRGRRDVQPAHRLVVAERVFLDNLHRLELLEPSLLCDLVLSLVGIVLEMPHVRDVAHVAYFVSKVAEKLLENVEGHAGACMSQVGISVHGRAADIHSDMTRSDRYKLFLPPGHGICKIKVSHRYIRFCLLLLQFSEYTEN